MTKDQRKYEFVEGDTKVAAPGIVAKRIRALVSIPAFLWSPAVAPGDLGGYVAIDANLAQVSGNAWVYGDALVYGDAWVSGNARVSGNAQVSGNAWVYGNAQVSGNARVSGDAKIEKSADHLQVGPAKSSGRYTTAYRDAKIGIRVSCGCFSGTVAEYSAQIESTHKDRPEYLKQYRLFCQLIAYNFDVPQ